MDMDEIASEALKLDSKSRARLARRLLESLEELPDTECEVAWLEEASRRARDGDEDTGSFRPAGDVLRNLRSKLR